MAKVNEFETAQTNYTGGSKQRFSDNANDHYLYSSADDLLSNLDDLSEMIQDHVERQIPRLKELQEYYKGNNTYILREQRRKETDLADFRATHNFAKYVSQFIQGYMVGVPLKTTYPDDNTNEQIRDMNRQNDADEHNSDLVLDQSIYGRAYELLYRGHDDLVHFASLDVLETFVVYKNDVERKSLLAVRHLGNRFEDGITVQVYTENKQVTYRMDNAFNLKPIEEKEHYFQGVPVVEYENNKFRQGDFEDALSLIDLYDASQSDTANYMQDLNDAMLKIKGNLNLDVDEARKQKDANIIMLQPEQSTEGRYSDVDAEYIYKKYDVNGTEAYKDRIFNNILLFTSIPNLLDDEKGAGPQSGEALKMKLFALSQKRATKERLFKKSLRDRYRLIRNISEIASEADFEVNDITITFTENLPSMIERELEWFAKAGGELSQKTLLSQLSFVDNPDEEIELIKEENKLSQDSYSFPVGGDDE